GMLYYETCPRDLLDAIAEPCWNLKVPNVDGCVYLDAYGNPCVAGDLNDHYPYGYCVRVFPIHLTGAGTQSTWRCETAGTDAEVCYGDTRARYCAAVYYRESTVLAECTPILKAAATSPALGERECVGGRVAGVPLPVACAEAGASGACAEAYPHHGPEPILERTCAGKTEGTTSSYQCQTIYKNTREVCYGTTYDGRACVYYWDYTGSTVPFLTACTPSVWLD
ncbi:MAG TPA: hypothetical protein VNZ52_07445, partial [Candidatus Thermoplasmatota archaeon]|nr:hypothetical protein [Candidatus Thermoplasmatota archaeon]